MKEQLGKILLGLFTCLGILGMLYGEYHFKIKNQEPGLYFMAGDNLIKAWKDEKIYYLFLPSYVNLEEVTLASFSPEFYVIEEGETVEKKESLKEIPLKKSLQCQCVESKEHFILQILQSENLPAIFVETRDQDLDKIKESKEYESLGTMVIVDEKGLNRQEEGLAKIKGRGNTSFAGYEKKPYSLELKEEGSILNLPGGKKYALLSNASDPSLIRNDIVRKMEVQLGLSYAHPGRFVDLYIDGTYEGNYYLCDDIDIGEEKINIKNMQAAMDLIYTYQNYQSEEIYETEVAKARIMSVSPDDITGGYLLEREYSQRYENEYSRMASGFVTKGKEHFVVKNPSYCSAEQIEYIRSFVNEAEAAIEDPMGKNPVTGKRYTEYIDLHSFVKKYLAEEVSKNYDGGVSSSYFYKDSDKNGGKLSAGPGWDYDMSLGNYVDWMEEFSSNPEGISELTHHTYHSPWYTNLYEKPDFYELVEADYREYVSPYLQQLLEKGLKEYEVFLRESAYMNEIRWKQELMKNPYYENREKTFQGLEQFIRERKAYLDNAWNVTF